jgi:hypothetical protein
VDGASESIVLLLGRGASPYPKKDPERVTAVYGDSVGLDLVSYAQRVLNELYDVTPNWDAEDLLGAAERAVSTVAARHPELNRDALEALRWSYTYSYK